MHYDAFNTAIIEAEAILNRRPLTHISTDSRDTEAITPNHLLSPSTAHLQGQPRVESTPISDGKNNTEIVEAGAEQGRRLLENFQTRLPIATSFSPKMEKDKGEFKKW